MNFNQEDIDFLDGLNTAERPESRIYLTAQHGYMRNLDRGQLQHLENIMKRYINDRFVLCFHCPADILKMVLTIYKRLDAERAQEQASAEVAASEPAASSEPVPTAEPKKKSKPKTPPAEKIVGEGDE